MDIRLLYADTDLLVISKPPFLLSVPGRAPEKQDSVQTRLAQTYPGVRTVHRLDWETSGLMVFALNADTHRQLSRQFEQRLIQKRYLAVVEGIVEPDEFTIDLPLICDWPNRPRQKIDPENGKASQTFVKVLGKKQDRTLLQLAPITGRSHQLRVHCQAIGHAILGDPLYGSDQGQRMADRLLLHAEYLAFTHPNTQENRAFVDTAPFDLIQQ